MRVVSRLTLAMGGGLAALSVVACDTTLEEACADLAAAECDHLRACSDTLFVAAYGDPGTCERTIAASCAAWPSLPGAHLGGGDIEACAQAYGGHPCDRLLLHAAPAACRFRGKRANGSECSSGAQCQSSFCRPGAEDLPGECAAVRELADTCSQAGSPCAAGLYCSQSGRCVPFGSPGDACGALAPCNPLYWCDAGLCAAPAGEGGQCAPCAGGATCDLLSGLVCGASGTCQSGDVSALVVSDAPACK